MISHQNWKIYWGNDREKKMNFLWKFWLSRRESVCKISFNREEKEKYTSKSWISRGDWEFLLQNLDNRDHLEKWTFNSPVRDKKKWTISSRDGESRQCLSFIDITFIFYKQNLGLKMSWCIKYDKYVFPVAYVKVYLIVINIIQTSQSLNMSAGVKVKVWNCVGFKVCRTMPPCGASLAKALGQSYHLATLKSTKELTQALPRTSNHSRLLTTGTISQELSSRTTKQYYGHSQLQC